LKPQNESESKKFDGFVNIDKIPNIAELFNLFPFFMYMNGTVNIDGIDLYEYKYSYPMQKFDSEPDYSEVLIYFQKNTMDLDRIII
jgi:hypothetical protein